VFLWRIDAAQDPRSGCDANPRVPPVGRVEAIDSLRRPAGHVSARIFLLQGCCCLSSCSSPASRFLGVPRVVGALRTGGRRISIPGPLSFLSCLSMGTLVNGYSFPVGHGWSPLATSSAIHWTAATMAPCRAAGLWDDRAYGSGQDPESGRSPGPDCLPRRVPLPDGSFPPAEGRIECGDRGGAGTVSPGSRFS